MGKSVSFQKSLVRVSWRRHVASEHHGMSAAGVRFVAGLPKVATSSASTADAVSVPMSALRDRGGGGERVRG